jgi:hypothetical protein
VPKIGQCRPEYDTEVRVDGIPSHVFFDSTINGLGVGQCASLGPGPGPSSEFVLRFRLFGLLFGFFLQGCVPLELVDIAALL